MMIEKTPAEVRRLREAYGFLEEPATELQPEPAGGEPADPQDLPF